MSTQPEFEAVPAAIEDILTLREDYRAVMAAQIVHDSWHARGWTDAYLLRHRGGVAGYGAVAGDPAGPRDVIREFHLSPAARRHAVPLLDRLIAASGARRIVAQTNDRLLTLLLFDVATDLESGTILFEDAAATALAPGGATVRALTDADRGRVFPHEREPVGPWGLEWRGEIVATGGMLHHYNPPYADLFMEVAPGHRRRGFGSLLVQELKRIGRERGHVPAARCRADNLASRRTLERAGMLPCARIVSGRIAESGAHREGAAS
jgi:GNAT superfamily N-acetyltransferase